MQDGVAAERHAAQEEVLRRGHDAAQRHLAARSGRPVAPSASDIEALSAFDIELPTHGTEPLQTLDLLETVGGPGTITSNGPRYFGFVTGGAQPAAMAAAALASAWDQNAALPVMSPTAAALDAVAVRWVVDLLGLAPSATGTFCGGASEANLIAMIAARDAVLAKEGWDVQADGLAGGPSITVITSAETHASMKKAIGLAGLGRDQCVLVETTPQGAMDSAAGLEAIAAVDGPTIVALQAGNVNTGHSDPFAELIPAAHDAGAWVHVDGAFGLWAAACPSRADLVAGVAGADSWAVDAHKWLNVNYDSALALIADGDNLARSMRADGAYLPSSAGERVPMNLGLQMSQRARAIEVWAALHTLGRSGVADLIEGSCALAERFAEQLVVGGAEVLHDVVLNQVLVAFGSDDMTDAVIDAVQKDGTCWAGGTSWPAHQPNARKAMRLSVSGWETSDADIDAAAAAILRCWSSLAS